MIFALTVSYRGTDYAGWQRQPNAVTVQQVLEEALERALERPAHVVGAGRTDAGVHARGQVAHLELPESVATGALVFGTNHHLPDDVRVLSAARMSDDFHARKSAIAKTYSYRMIRGRLLSPLDSPFAISVPVAISRERLEEAAALLPGRHDFSAFALAGGAHGQPYRRIFSAGWEEGERGLVFTVTGEGFLRGMVRSLVGTLIEIGLDLRPVDDLDRLLEGAPRGEAGRTAAARGLTLERVDYAVPVVSSALRA